MAKMTYSEFVEKQKKKNSQKKAGKMTYREFREKYASKATPEQEQNTSSGYFKAGAAFEDGYHFGDLTKTILGTTADAGVNIVKGAGSLVEGITDLGVYGVSGIAGLLGADDVAYNAKVLAQENSIDKIFSGVENATDRYSVFGDKSDAIAQGIGQVGGIIATGGLGAGAGLGAAGATALTTGVTFASSMGGSMSEAYQSGATDEQALTYGLISGAGDAATELLFGGLGKAVGAVGLSKGISSLDDALAKAVSSKFSNQIAKNFVEFGIKAGAEGTEEVLAGIVSAVGKKVSYMSEEDFGKILEDENLLDQFVAGAVTSGFAQSGYVPGMRRGSLREANKTGRDFISGLTKNEQTVIDTIAEERIKEAEKDGKTLTAKQREKIRIEVENEMDDGGIDIDKIESILGGEDYKSYTSLVEEMEELKTLNNIKASERTGAQDDRLAELKEKNKAASYESEKTRLKGQLAQNVQNMVKNDRLIESYNEKGRRSQAYEADLSKYDKVQQATIQNAINSGILNNTNKTHKFVDMIAKISADKGVSFDFTSNEKLKETGFALEGRTVNGYIQGGNVTLNVNSAKALNKVVGHEITHVLEGTDLYDTLQKTIIDYAKSKGDYDARAKTLTELYKDVENADINEELTADLVGDYLFSDPGFVNRLSTEQPSLFKKIYDEIKYLVKVATAESKEAKQLLEVQRAFEKAYKENDEGNKAGDGIKYSLAENAATELHKALYDKNYREDVRLRDESPAIMTAQKGVKNLPMVMKASHIRENVFTEEKAKSLGLRVDNHTHYHGLGEDFFLKVIDSLDDVDLAYRGTKNASDSSRRENYFLLISKFTDEHGNTVNVPVYINEHAQHNRVFVDVNKVSTVFGRDNFEAYIRNQVKNKNLVRIKNRSIKSSERNALIAKGYRDNASTDIISQEDENATSNRKSSLSSDEKMEFLRNDIYGKDIALDLPIRSDIAPVQEEAAVDVLPIREDVQAQTDPLDDDLPIREDLKPEVQKSIEEKKEAALAELGDKESFMRNKAEELLNELKHLGKGKKASQELGYFLDLDYPWSKLKQAFANVRGRPAAVVDAESGAEAIVREAIGRDYDQRLDDILYMDLNTDVKAEERAEILTVKDRNAAKLKAYETEMKHQKQMREDSYGAFNEQIATIQQEYESKKNKNTQVANHLLQRIERLKTSRDATDASYEKRINDIKARVDKMHSREFKTAEQRMTKQQEYRGQVRELIGDISKWVDKKLGMSYKINTLKRNLRDIVRDEHGNQNFALADKIYDFLQGEYNRNEALLNKEANTIKQMYRDLKINAAEDAYIQMLGEYRHNPETTILAEDLKEYYETHKDKIDDAKVDQIIDSARTLYDELFKRINVVLKEQGMQEIGYREGYFPHFTEDKQSWLAKIFNWKTQNNDIPTDIAGLTENFNPNRSWQSFNKHRTGDSTDFSFMKGLDTYVNGALDWIYHIEDIQKRRAFENEIRYQHSEQGVKDRVEEIRNNEMLDADQMQEQIDLVYENARNPLNNFVSDFRTQTNTLAGKKSSMDRGVEEYTNRKFYSTMTNISNRVTANMVGGSISSALTNFIPITQSWGEVSPISSLRAMRDTIRASYSDDGIVAKSDFLTNRLEKNKNLYQSNWDKAIDKVGILMEVVDNFTSQSVWRSKYLENLSKGMSETESIANADQFAENVMAGRSRGNNPTIFDSKNPLMKVFTAFQLEVNNQYGYMFKDMPQEMQNEAKGKLVAGYAKMFLGAYAYNALYSSLTGRDAAFDPIGIIEDVLKDLGLFGEEEEEEDAAGVILNLTDSILEEVPFVGGLIGGGRIPISSALPYDGLYEAFSGTVQDVADGDWKNLTNEWLNPVLYLASPVGGGQMRKTAQGLAMFDDDLPIAGSYTSSGKLRFSVEDNLPNRLQAAVFGQYASKEARQYFDQGRTPLSDTQLQELIDMDLPIADYWKHKDEMKGMKSIDEKADYIANLDLPIATKNKMVNSLTDREEPIELTDYDQYGSLEEMDYATKYPGKYAVMTAIGGYSAYKEYKAAMSEFTGNGKKRDIADYINSLDISFGEKMLLFKSQYPSDKTYNKQILEYLNERDDISYSQKKLILEELGFTVDDNGKIRW